MEVFKLILRKQHLYIFIVSFYLLYRLAIDFLYINEKPYIFVIIFIGYSFILLVLAFRYLKLKDIVVFVLLALLLVYPLLFSLDNLVEQFEFSLKIVLPIIVIVSSSRLPINYEEFRAFLRRITLPVLAVFIVMFLMDLDDGIAGSYDTFINNPIHPISQSIAKLSFLYVGGAGSIFYSALFLFALYFLNVRSNLFGVLGAHIAAYGLRKGRLLFLVAVLISVLLLYSITITGYIEVMLDNEYVSRLLIKNRREGGEWFSNFDSGRMFIWKSYVTYLAEEYEFINYIFGKGSPHVIGVFTINAHNDVLNLLAGYGLFGFLLLSVAWYNVYLLIERKYRVYCVIYFVFIFLTNGIVFHQSNVYFLIYLAGSGVRTPNHHG